MSTPSESTGANPFALCLSVAEVMVVSEALFGRELALLMLRAAHIERQPLQNAARELKRGGKAELAALVIELARQAPKATWWRAKRRPGKWRTPSAKLWIERRRAVLP
ncbi:hypothetical protein [Bradyrhizobium sp. SZCCHNRI1002]|uniref:hypothetical protein n=1 Tax=Bradyrhizobium sp. SZCCHNRI1002 TaxID=3057274 RepID=UPI0028EA527B|nr:hypothetical protein [Bradyrhizobium sp. SZCCHNRI1002]